MSRSIADWVSALQAQLEPWELAELNDSHALSEAFSGDLTFGTGGIRCLMGVGPNRVNRLTIGKAAQGLAYWLKKMSTEDCKVVIGYDTRFHSRMFAEVTACVLTANNIHAILFQTYQPTPMLDFAVRRLECSAGVCITASHNARGYNGFKVYDSKGVQATDAMAHAIQAEIENVDVFSGVRTMPLEQAVASGLLTYVDDALPFEYVQAVLNQRFGEDCSDLQVVYSPLCGTGLFCAQHVFDSLGIQWSLMEDQANPDGSFKTCPIPNPENPETMVSGFERMSATHTDLFLATDPDADRLGVACMDHGVPRLLTGNEVGILLFDFACRFGRTSDAAQVAVTTIVTTSLLERIAAAHNVELRHTLTGFKYVGEQIGRIQKDEKDFLLGIEESDGYLRGSYVRDKDGICAIVLVCEVAAYYKSQNMTLADALEALYRRYGYVRDCQLSLGTSNLAGNASVSCIMDALRSRPPASLANRKVERIVDYRPGASMHVVGCNDSCNQILPPSNVLEWRLEHGSRVLVRPSGTEPKLKAYVFSNASTASEAEDLLRNLCDDVSLLLESRCHTKGSVG